MKIISAIEHRFVIVETDIGDFRVWSSLAIDEWKFDIDEWGYFSEFKYSEEVVNAIKDAAKAVLFPK